MKSSENINKSDKQIAFRVTEKEYKDIMIQAALDSSLSPNQYAKQVVLNKINTDSLDQIQKLKES
ncbi:hypothetical protein 2F1_8 [Uncultured Caudovirales phage clone 2F_1]|uniref:Uncharacterized protein n=1 Tax=Uncultured Caudovirales phage clone 2F_1 TaxID=2992576 RepID=A0A2H4JAF2_9CAUD|nr:hypothetical protein [Acinetobacter radioresistens]YP_010092436.1 hypothetical protein KNT73_gp08 [Uncultured Caudovirales phage clone 2F_1]ASN71609.1 hypothetical protein 2F1_8 [Uncultured Caudovirales phage clone 2F_1]RJL74406.1 hypothetical protein D5055_02715 [Acinetobacter radioresistens]